MAAELPPHPSGSKWRKILCVVRSNTAGAVFCDTGLVACVRCLTEEGVSLCQRATEPIFTVDTSSWPSDKLQPLRSGDNLLAIY